jgi:hypothetical protein
VSLTSPITATGVEAQTNALHRCPRISDIEALPPYYAVPNRALRPVAAAAAGNVEGMIQARGISQPLTREALLDLRRGIVAALDVFAVATARYEVEVNGASVDTATASYWHQMRSIINAQIDGIQTGYKVIDAINRGEISGEVAETRNACPLCHYPTQEPGLCSDCHAAALTAPTSTEDLPPSDTHATDQPEIQDLDMLMAEFNAAAAAVYVDTVVADAAAGRIDLDAVIAATDTPMDREMRLEVAASRAEMGDVDASTVAMMDQFLDSITLIPLAPAPWDDRRTDGGDLVALEAADNARRPAGANDWPSDADVPF